MQNLSISITICIGVKNFLGKSFFSLSEKNKGKLMND